VGRENIREKEPIKGPGKTRTLFPRREKKKKGTPRKIEGIIIPFISLFIPVARFTKVGELGNVNYISSHLVSLVEASRTRRLNPSSLRISNRIRGLCPHNQLRSTRGRGGGTETANSIRLVNKSRQDSTCYSFPFPRERKKQTKTTNPFSSSAKQVKSTKKYNRCWVTRKNWPFDDQISAHCPPPTFRSSIPNHPLLAHPTNMRR
jgi:hypothetical protein